MESLKYKLSLSVFGFGSMFIFFSLGISKVMGPNQPDGAQRVKANFDNKLTKHILPAQNCKQE